MPCAGRGPPAPGGVPSRPLPSPAAQTSRPSYPLPTVALSSTPAPREAASMDGPNWSLRIRDLVKVFNHKVRANDGISLTVEPGEVYGLLGPNGAARAPRRRRGTGRS